MECLNKIGLLFLFLFVFLGCKQKAIDNNSAQSTVIESPFIVNNTKINNANQKWKQLVNSKSEAILTLYDDNAIKILENEKTLIGNNQIKDYYQSYSFNVSSLKTDKVIMANPKRVLEYEIGTFTDQQNKKYKHLIIWKTKESIAKRVFEFVAEIEDTDNDLKSVDDRRQLWMELCNKNNSANLINEMYSINTLYYNHKPLIIGREALIEEYSYMNNEKYELYLNPIVVEKVKNNLVFEIGQCKGGYKGKYIIIWKKNQNGKWEVIIDSNI